MKNKELWFVVINLLFPPLLILTSHSVCADSLEIQKISDRVYAVVGELNNRTPENLGNNATFGVVITSKGVVLIDSGGTYKGAAEIHNIIKQITNKPVVTVINTGGQDHRWMGNGYFKNLGAEIIANTKAVIDQKARTQDQFFMLGNLVGMDTLKGTEAFYADKTFDEQYKFVSGETQFEIYHAGQAHTPGDSFIWLPKERIMFAGDIVYTERILGVLDHSNSKNWIKTYEAMASFKPKHLVPGHGHLTTMSQAKSDTYDYLVFLRESVEDFMDNGGDMSEINKVDQSRFKYLYSYDVLAGRNAQSVYSELEWE